MTETGSEDDKIELVQVEDIKHAILTHGFERALFDQYKYIKCENKFVENLWNTTRRSCIKLKKHLFDQDAPCVNENTNNIYHLFGQKNVYKDDDDDEDDEDDDNDDDDNDDDDDDDNDDDDDDDKAFNAGDNCSTDNNIQNDILLSSDDDTSDTGIYNEDIVTIQKY